VKSRNQEWRLEGSQFVANLDKKSVRKKMPDKTKKKNNTQSRKITDSRISTM
jgi:hypothetical protein